MKVVVFRLKENGEIQQVFGLPLMYDEALTVPLAREILFAAKKKHNGPDYSLCSIQENGPGCFELWNDREEGEEELLAAMHIMDAPLLELRRAKLTKMTKLLVENPELREEIEADEEEDLRPGQ